MSNSTDYFINAKKCFDVDSLADQIKVLTVIDAAAPKPRIINSTCVYPLAFGEISAVPKNHQDFFLADSELAPYKN